MLVFHTKSKVGESKGAQGINAVRVAARPYAPQRYAFFSSLHTSMVAHALPNMCNNIFQLKETCTCARSGDWRWQIKIPADLDLRKNLDKFPPSRPGCQYDRKVRALEKHSTLPGYEYYTDNSKWLSNVTHDLILHAVEEGIDHHGILRLVASAAFQQGIRFNDMI